MSLISRCRRPVLAASLTLALVAVGCAGEDALDTPDDTTDDAPDDAEDDADTDQQDTEDPTDDASGEPLVVGSANFSESVMMANMYALALEEIGVEVETRTNIGAREVYFPALQQGELDLLPEYTGSLLAFVSEDEVDISATDEQMEALRDLLEPDVRVLEPSDAQNRNGWAVTQETAEEYGLEVMSDLTPVADELVAGGAPETRERPTGLPGMEEVYDVVFADFIDLDPGGPLTAEALEQGDIDVARIFTSQGVIAANDWVVLDDDQGLTASENLVPVVRDDALTDDIRAALEAVSAALTFDELVELNRRVEVDNEDPDLVAEDWLIDQGLYSG